MNPIAPFLAWLRSRRLSRIAAEQERRREIIKRQIADRREHHREFRPLYGELKHSTTAALAADLGRDWPAKFSRREA